MNYKRLCHNRICRVLICLALICCLIAQMVPARADATAAGLAVPIVQAAGVTVSAPVAFGAMAIALGVMAGTNEDFQNLVQAAASSGFEWVKDGTVELLRTVDALGTQAFYVAGEFLESLRSAIFGTGVLTSSYASSFSCGFAGKSFRIDFLKANKLESLSGSVFVGKAYLTSMSEYMFVLYAVSASKGVARVYRDGNSTGDWGLNVPSGGVFYLTSASYAYSTTGSISSSGVPVVDLGTVNNSSAMDLAASNYLVPAVSSPYDLSLGHIPTYSLDGSLTDDAFSEYMAKQIRFQNQENPEDPEGDESNYDWMVPLSLGAAGTVYAMTQAEQWLGSTSSDFSDYETVTDYTIVDSTMSNIGTDSNSTTVPFIIVDTTNAGGSTSPSEPSDEGETIPGAGAVTATLLEKLFGGISDKLDLTYTSIREIPELLKEFMLDVKTGFSELPSKFAEWFNNIQTSLELLVSGQLTLGQLLGEFLSPLIDAFKSLLQSLFSPSPNFIANKVDSLVAKYPHFNVFIGLGTQLKSFFLGLGSTPPIVYIDLGAATGSYFFGGRQAFIDLSWYADYKPSMDAILGAFIWLWLAWRIFLALPGIINGSSGAAGSIIRYSERNLKSQDGRSDK